MTNRLPSPTTFRAQRSPEAVGLKRSFFKVFQWMNAVSSRGLPERMNPLAQTGAIANTLFIIAAATGIALLIWYRPSVHQAYDSVTLIRQSPMTAQLLRSMHRYSSDACMFFVIVHALYLFFAGRFRGPRWLAWVTGILLWTLLEAIGWTGYWLVWDQRGQLIATASARVLDLVPIFSDPMSRSFLTNDSVNSLFFFVIFFFHMLVPLAMAVAIWLHISRVSRPDFIASRPVALALMIGLMIISIALPADMMGRADMLQTPSNLSMDWWYLAPVWLLQRTTGGLFLGLFLLAGALLYSLPFWRRSKPAAAEVTVSRCNACMKCYQDCPYNAIAMVPRTDGKNYVAQASVDPDRCVSCGICAGSCDSAGIGVPYLDVLQVRRKLEDRVAAVNPPPFVLFYCQESFQLNPDDTGHSDRVPGYLIQEVPCLGWIHPLTVERLIKRGVQGVLIAGCGDGTCTFREGATWTGQRFAGQREPALRSELLDSDRIKIAKFDVPRISDLQQQATRFRQASTDDHHRRRWWARSVAAAAIIVVLSAIALFSRLPLPDIQRDAVLIVSFKHAGEIKTQRRERSEEELAALPVHMRSAYVETRERAPVHLRVELDGQAALDRAFAPKGVMADGRSIAVEQIRLTPGKHHIQIAIRDKVNPVETTPPDYQTSREIDINAHQRVVVLFNSEQGFTWHTPSPAHSN